MTRRTTDDRTDADVQEGGDDALQDAGHDGHSRRALMTRAGGLLAAGAAVPLLAAPSAGAASRKQILDTLATFETFGVTLLSEAVRRSPGTRAEQFAAVTKAANTTEFLHLRALRGLGARATTSRFWIPDAVFDGNAGVFDAVARQEEVEISVYLLALSAATRRRDVREARLHAEALGTEAEHRVLARYARSVLTGTAEVPNDRGFERLAQKSPAAAIRATERLGIGIGERGAAPGRFYTFGGDPRRNGTGSQVIVPNPT